MARIVAPLSRGMSGSEVADLQEGLQLLLERNQLFRDDDSVRRELAAALRREQGRKAFGNATAKLVAGFQDQYGLESSGQVDERTASVMNDLLGRGGGPVEPERPVEPENPVEPPPEFRCLVRGHVKYRGGLSIPDATVRAFHRELRSEVELGEAKTDEDGNFEIYYNFDGSRARGSSDRPPDLFVRVSDQSGEGGSERVLGESPTHFAAQPILKIRVQINGGPARIWSDFEQIEREVAPYLNELKASDLVEDDSHQDVSLLAGKLAVEPERLAAFVAAHRLAAEVDGDPAVFYALVRRGLPSNLSELLAVPAGARSRALAGAIRAGVAPGRMVGEVRKVREAFKTYAARYSAADKTDEGRARLGALLKAGIGNGAKAEKLAAAMMSHKGPTESMWAGLKEDRSLASAVPKAQLTLQLAAATGRHLPLISSLLERRVDRVEDLASFSKSDWLDIINAQDVPEADRVPPTIEGKDLSERAEVYASTITRLIADTMPTQVLARKALADEANDAPVRAFWKNVASKGSGFELGKGPVGPLLESRSELLDGIDDREAVTAHLGETQRLFALTADYEEQKALRAAGLTSSQAVARVGQGAFVQKMGGTALSPRKAVMIYDRAARVSGAALTLLGTYAPALARADAMVIPSVSQRKIPNLPALFGSMDLCACQHCRSVHSPSAYFADLLAWLDDRSSLAAGRSAREVLFSRRPDLGEIELTCANTHTVLPYTDLVNEILERRIAPFEKFGLAGGASAELDSRTLSDEVRDEFAGKGHELSARARVVVARAGERWSVTDGSILYSIEKGAAGPRVTGAWPQTGAPAETLAAVPEHVNQRAYERLREAVYPLVLPLDLPTEEVRTFLGHLGCPRHQLMAELLASGPAAALEDVSIAAEYLGLSDIERAYVTGDSAAPDHEAWEYWGLDEDSNAIMTFDPAAGEFVEANLQWLKALGWIPELLRRSGLDYEILVRILGCEFVNPGRAARIESIDPADPATCDTGKLVLKGLTKAMAGRLTRFVRLWLKVGGEPEELDLFLSALCNGKLNDLALVKLSHLARLRSELDLGTEQLVALWSPIPSDGESSLYRRLFLNADVIAPLDPAFTLATTGELAIVADDPAEARIARHASPVLAALRLSSADLAALQSAGVASDDNLTLANLSLLHRHALLARSLGLGVADLLLLKAMAGIDPFSAGATADTLRFVELARSLSQTGLQPSDVAYLLFHQAPGTAPIAPPPGAISELVAELRRQLRVVRDSTMPRPDPAGEALRRELAALRWPSAMIDEALAAIGGTRVSRAQLDPAPPDFAVPAAYAERLVHDPDAKTLTLTGSLTAAERTALAAAFPTQSYKDAIEALFNAPRQFAQDRLRAFGWPAVTVPLPALPAGLTFPPALRSRVSYDPAAQRLKFDGTMSAADKAALDSLSTDAAYRSATATLLSAAEAFVPSAENRFVTPEIASALFEEPIPADRFAMALALVLARRRTEESTRLAVRLIAEAAGMKPRLAERLMTRDLPHPSDPARRAVAAFLEEPFASSDVEVPPTEAAFPASFSVALRMTKIAALVREMKLSDRLIDWLFAFGPGVVERKVHWGGGAIKSGWLRLADIPAQTEAVAPARFASWLRLALLSRIGRLVPGGETNVEAVFRSAREPGASADSVTAALGTLTGWDPDELQLLAAAIGVTLPSDLADEEGLARLAGAARRLRRLGTGTVQAQAWAAASPTAAAGTAARRAVQASYGPEEWADAIRPLEDVLREKRRSALVAYLAVRPDPSRGETWTDSNGMFGHLLIDVETQPVVLTSRLKQAIGSVQLGIQRFMMNLDEAVAADEAQDIGWRQWPSLKQYRVWEANRKVFLYPENWIEPELRDDKSPFFLELENALLQSDVTSELAERAYGNYLARLDEVARLEVAGMFHQPGEGGAPDELHVFACTQSHPPVHFYRKWIGQTRWTPWQRLDLDIPRGQILPLMWNRRLYLFWPLFSTKTRKPPAGGDKPVEGEPYFEISLAWSEQRQGLWSAKKTTPPEVTVESVLKPTSAPDEGRMQHVFRADVNGAELLVWYESSDLVATKLDQYGNVVRPGGAVATGGWRFSGCNGRVTRFKPANIGVFPPPNTHARGMGYEETSTFKEGVWGPGFTQPVDNALQLPKGMTGTDPEAVLRRTPGAERFRLLGPHQEQFLSGRMPFFFHDDSQTLFIVPRQATEWVWRWDRPDSINPKVVDVADRMYFQPDLVPDPLGPVAGRWDPLPVIEHKAKAMRLKEQPLSVAGGLAEPVLPAMATAGLTSAARSRSMSLTGTSVATIGRSRPGAFSSAGDLQMFEVDEYLRPGRLTAPTWLSGESVIVRRYEFQSFYHPFACAFMRELNLKGTNGLLRRNVQLWRSAPFELRYGPTALVERGSLADKEKYPVEEVDFEFDGAYSAFNWELFFHVPMMIACKLSQNQRFEEAQRWFHTIFDPTDSSSASAPAKYWRTRPFFEQEDYLNQRIERLAEALARGEADESLTRQLSEWIANPFRPFAIARLRTVAFQKMVVMKYLDNLIAWGDQLFRRDTIESINEATQLYILAAEILGPRPTMMAPRASPETHTYNTLSPKFEELTNELTEIEAVISSPRVDAVLTSPDSPPLVLPQMLYFCVTPNDRLLGYWDTVGDRLFKIRNSLNLAGIRRTLPLFEPPIDPALLVKAAAAGADLSSAIADLSAPAPFYRFRILSQKAVELCQEVKGLGSALLSALERRDAEELSRIQAVHEISLLREVKKVRDDEIRESKAQIMALEAARELASERYRHASALLGRPATIPAEGTVPADAEPVPQASTLMKEGVRMIAQESNELSEMADAADAEEAASNWDAVANVGYLVPTFAGLATPWGVGLKTEYGGAHVGSALSAIANLWRSDAAEHRHKAQKASRLAQFILRANDWKLEANLAAREIARIDKDLAAARIKEAIATANRDNHLKQMEQREQQEEFLRTKYTSRELYDWMVGQISAVYFQAYQLAYDTARRAERAFRRELAVPDTDFVRFGYWDSLRKGLLAGDRLLHDVRRMEVAYLDQNQREYEVTKAVSLATLHPEGLIALQEQGSCFLDLPEAIFDLDHPGQYLRRIKSVRVTVPAVTGPYTSIPCKLTLLSNRIRIDPRPTPQDPFSGTEDRRFEISSGGIQSVVISSGRDDPGLFDGDLRDDRYLPFEGAGVTSSWRIELPAEFRQFDYRAISDVILHIRYTSREGGDALRGAAVKQLSAALKAMEVEKGRDGLSRGFSSRHDFPDSWHAFAHKPDGQAGTQLLELPLTAARFPGFAAGRAKAARILVALVPAPGLGYDNDDRLALTLRPPTGAAIPLTLESKPTRAGGLPMAEIVLQAPVAIPSPGPDDPGPPPWTIELTAIPDDYAREVDVEGAQVERLDPAKVADLVLLVGYSV